PDSIEDTQKSFILLAVYLLKFQSQSTELFPGGGFEEIGFGIIRTQGVPFRPVNDGGQLEQITDRENLHTPERQGVAPDIPQGIIYRVENICPNHRYFIYNKQFQFEEHLPFILTISQVSAQTIGIVRNIVIDRIIDRDKSLQRESEHGMDGRSRGLDSGDTGRCHHDAFFGGIPDYMSEKCSLPCSCLSGKKDRSKGFIDKLFCQFKFFVQIHGPRISTKLIKIKST